MKGYIFDLDGTLLDSMAIWNVLSIHFLERFNKVPQENLIEQLKSLSLQEAAMLLKEQYHLNQSISQIQEEFYQQLEKEYKTVTLKEGVLLFLKKCFQQNIPMYLLTANHSQLTHSILQQLNIKDYFQSIITSDDSLYTKRDVTIYQWAAETINLSIEQCIVVEDALHAIKTAKKSGAYVKAIYDQENEKDWQEICQIADVHYRSFLEMEV